MTGEYAWTRLFGQASAVRKLLGGWDLEEAGESPQDFDLSLLAATLLNVVVTYRLTGCEVPSDVWKEAISEYPELSSEYRCYYTTWCQTGDKAVAFLGEEGWLGTTGDEAIRSIERLESFVQIVLALHGEHPACLVGKKEVTLSFFEFADILQHKCLAGIQGEADLEMARSQEDL
jgi:hypothetical protein